jgi:D-arginine dehydrogenase
VDRLPTSTDVVVVGAGVAGVATAWWLARRGADVVVIEREPAPGRHASGRGAGLGRQITDDDATTAYAVRGAAYLRGELPGRWPGGAPWIATGSFLTFADAGQLDAHRLRAARFGIACDEVAIADVVARWPAIAGLPARGALFVPGDGVIRLDPLIDGLVAGARDAGGRIVVGCEVGAVDVIDGRPRIATNLGSIDARIVVDAAGAWAGTLARGWGVPDPGLTPWKRHLHVVGTPASGTDVPFVWHVAPGEIYVRADDGGMLVSACDAVPVTPHVAIPDDDAVSKLRARLRGTSPSLAAADVTRTWACLRTFTRDGKPRIGVDAERPWLCWVIGLGGHGATGALAIGEDAASAIA